MLTEEQLAEKTIRTHRRLACTKATEVRVIVEVEGPDGVRRASWLRLSKEMLRESVHAAVVDCYDTAVQSYDRLESVS